jgi:signal transduction histidine kinase
MGVKRMALKVGEERLRSLTNQLGSMFGQSSQNYIAMSRKIASCDSITNYLISPGQETEMKASAKLKIMHKDSISMQAELLDANKKLLLRSSKSGVFVTANLSSIISELSIGPDSSKIGKLQMFGDSIYYPVVGSVMNNKQIIGYIIVWRFVRATPQAIEQFTKLIGSDAAFYIGNSDGSLWTNMLNRVPEIKIDTNMKKSMFEFNLPDSSSSLAAVKSIRHTPWLVLVSFPKKTMFEIVNHFQKSTVIIGGLLLIIGMAIAWWISRSLTSPLKKLTIASSIVANGDYSAPVEVRRGDELGNLAKAFNSMVEQVRAARMGLEKKVQERTSQLENANKELEAFSYSVSHDLRAPLRAISSYASILKEDHGDRLDADGNKIADRIIVNAKMMGQLIDDLISFSQMGVKEVQSRAIDMKSLAKTCVNELIQNEPPNKYKVHIDDLPSCYGDPSLIKQVWLNLISNAIKYSSKEDEPKINIGYKGEFDKITYYVKDNGVGFDMQYAHKLFGVFQRLHNHNTFEGTGIGLAFAKRILVKHGGEIGAE